METEKKYKVLVYPDIMTSKKAAEALISKIKSTILGYPRELTLKEIVRICGNGSHPFAPIVAKGEGNLCAKNWVSQQIYALDFDNDDLDREGKKCVAHKPYYLTPEEAVNRSKRMGYTPAFGYDTLSNCHNHQRFRLVYVLDEPCTTKEEHDAVYAALASAFIVEDRCLIDRSCREQSRVFFGGTRSFSMNYRSVLSKKELVERGRNALKDGLDKKATPMEPAVQKNKLHGLIEALRHDADLIKENRKTSFDSLETPVFMRSRGILGFEQTRKRYNIYIAKQISVSTNREGEEDTKLFLSVQKLKSGSPLFTGLPEVFIEFCLHNVPFEDLFGVGLGSKFRCVLPGHDDVNASANIFVGDDGIYRYYCFGCKRHFNIFSFIQEVTNCSFVTACRLIATIFDIPCETEWQAECRDQISHYITLLSSDYFDRCYGILKKYLIRRRAMADFVFFLNVMSGMITDHKAVNSQKPMFCISFVRLQKKFESLGRKLTLDSIYAKVKMFAHLGLIEIIPDEQIPQKTLKVLRECQERNNREYRTNCYHVPLGSKQALDHATETILADKRCGARAKTISTREGLIRTSGEIEAMKVFAQKQAAKQKKANKKLASEVDKFYKSYVSAARNLIEKKGWTTEAEIIDRMHCLDKNRRRQYSQICMPQLLREEHLERVAFTKKAQAKYGIDNKKAKLTYGPSKVIVPRDKEEET